MTLFFNLELLETESKCDPKLMLSMLLAHLNKKLVPKNRYDLTVCKNLAGHSFLLDASSLFAETCDIAYKAQYIRLAGRRDYNSYKLYQTVYLDLSYFKDIDLIAIKHNPLLDIKQNKIYFKHENN